MVLSQPSHLSANLKLASSTTATTFSQLAPFTWSNNNGKVIKLETTAEYVDRTYTVTKVL